MPFRPEAEAAIAAEAARKPTDTAGWGCVVDGVGASPHQQVTVTNSDGFNKVFTVLDSEGLSYDQIQQSCMHDTIDEIRRRRALP